MTEASLDAFRHNAWATATLLDYCRGLSEKELNAKDALGTYGSIFETLRHFVTSEGYYRFLVTDQWPAWDWSPDEEPGLEVLQERAQDSAAFWEGFLSDGVDPEASITQQGEDGVEYEIKVGVILAQVLNHGNDHRSQVSMMITGLGKEPPDLQAWSYAEATGRAVPRRKE